MFRLGGIVVLRLSAENTNFISTVYTQASMTELSKHFLEECMSTTYRLEARTRHLLLLGNEGLYMLERWRTERHFREYCRKLED